VQQVASFANGADRTLDGDSIADPKNTTGYAYKRFSGPLFSSAGPAMTDIIQGTDGDCWLMATLAGIARTNPQAIRQNVADFGDGTYGVRLGNNFYREDGDLPVTKSGTPAFANLGAGNSLWVAVVEKAFAHYRTSAATYESLSNGWASEALAAFRATETASPWISSYSSADALRNALIGLSNNAKEVMISFNQNPSVSNGVINGTPLHDNHVYTLVGFARDTAGNLNQVILRNPWGFDGAGNDSNPHDGLVTVSIKTLYGCRGKVESGRV
jgi:hypothetical protein